ncbi:4Fe-4S dicluster domain-containing protein [Deferrisoma camini]|uniref:4Fe-4S dicluster domain-containing protein n=1 Tax=Deferrisoma camini TaxID=1035120 RepID=UPI00046CA321|nr:4Fe-4S dicluster domain-containing protein [Deferrisoma camini]
MRVRIETEQIGNDRIRKIEEVAAQSVYRCYQCGKCSAACPATPEMDMLPNQVIRYLQLGLEERVLEANTPWICASCLQCRAVCPKGVDLARIMEAVRMLQLRKGRNEIRLQDLPPEYLKRVPQILLISASRKFVPLS